MYSQTIKIAFQGEQLQLKLKKRQAPLRTVFDDGMAHLMSYATGPGLPNLDGEIVFDADEWKAAYLLAKK